MTVKVHTLANGMRIVTEAMPGLQSASIGVWVNAGGRNERPEQNGVAHFLEHMAFKGTSTRSALQIAQAIENVGGYINAYTSRETTAYYTRVLGADVPLALDVIADILRDSVFDEAEIETERHVILQEIGQANDTPDDIIFDWLQEAAFPDQAIGRSILGPAEKVAAFGRRDLTTFVGEHYSPDQFILAAAGDVDHDAIVAQTKLLFSDMAAGPAFEADLAQFKGSEHRTVRDLEQAHFAMALESPGYRSDDIYTAQVFATAFGGGMSSRLFQEAREKRGLCYSIFAQAGAFAETGMLTIYSGTGADEVGQLAELTIDEMRRAADDIDADEINRARAQLKAGLLMGLESPSSRAERNARLLSIWDRIPTVEETVALIDDVSVTKVRDLAGAMCTSGNIAMALLGPVNRAPSLDDLVKRAAA